MASKARELGVSVKELSSYGRLDMHRNLPILTA